MTGAVISLYRVAVSARTDWLVVRIADRDGASGWGECSDAGTPEAVAAHLDRPGDPADPFLVTTVRGALDQAHCDLEARRRGEPLWKWLGGSDPGPVRLYANINRMPGGRAPEDVAECALAAVRAGFRRIKFAPFDVPGDRPLPLLGLERARAVRAAVGPDVELMIDCHERLAPDELEPVLDALADLGLGWLEDATGIDDTAGLRRLRERTDLRLAGGEFAVDTAQVARARGLLDVVMPDVKHAGGVSAALDLAATAAECGAEVSFHNPSGPVATAVSAHLTGVAPGVLEFMFGEAEWRPAVVGGAERVAGGLLTLSPGPGIGLDLSPAHPQVTLLWSTP
ncbi:mandelate racemase/muconate lactonizing enzyme family protein [Actinomadura gamaensis]|uniref:Mandelate racemase/muconate lactonizing enzyme family protein n=1 Tax=Actinomadura gamaensis TaxID=1763541 RepID=A0ABV9TYT3_9ACTN